MKKYILSAPLAIAALLMTLSPQLALAHAHYTFQVDGKIYQFAVGSLNEPLIVDDKSGLDLTVTQGGGMPTMGPDGDMDGPPAAGVPVDGLDKTLKVEMIAGGQKKVMDLTPTWGKPGAYKTTFFPTVQTTFTYRLFGTLNNVPVDLSFTCNPAGHTQTPDDKSMVKISDKVMQTLKSGVFGCAEAKSDYGFPEQSMALNELNTKTQEFESVVSQARSARSLGIGGIAIALLGLIAGVGALVKGRRNP